jgi:pSer/pThr/pTyr-binding forkhead associated (FHA) protein
MTVDTVEEQGRRSPDPSRPLALVHIGSAENDFADAGRMFVLPSLPARVRFGRGDAFGARSSDSGMKVSVPSAWASGAHCELHVRVVAGTVELVLRDLGSRNGTLVDGRRIDGETPLGLDQPFEVGRSFWTLRMAPSGEPGREDDDAFVVPPLRHVPAGLGKVARTEVSVLVMGETGTGKERIARVVHERSGRTGPFVHLGVSGFDARRLEEELGEGSRRSPGIARRGRAGTLFLADVGRLDARAQVSVLAALERLPGGEGGIRVVSGSDVELRDLVARRRFRPELYSRLAGFEVRLPPLRDRLEDIALLVRQIGHDGDLPRFRLTTPAFRHLLGHGWPFNREQLHACLVTASMLPSGETTIGEEAIRDALRSRRTNVSSADSPPDPRRLPH